MSYNNKKFRKWTNDDLLAWIKTIGLSAKWQNMMIEAINDSGVTGKDLIALKNGKEVGDSFGITIPILYNRVFAAIQKVKKKELDNVTQAAAVQFSIVSVSSKIEQKQQDDKFELNLFGQHKNWKVNELVSANTRVNYVKEIYKRESGVKTAVDDIMLYSKGKVLAGNKTLGQCGIVDEKHLITVMFKAVGGMAQYVPPVDSSDDEEDRVRVINFKKYKNIKKSHKADCLIGYDDDDFIDRAEIGCPGKHAMAADTMFNYIVQVLEKNIKSVTIPCPMCKIALDWDHCTRIADMTGKEYAQWTRVIQQRLEGEVKTCPHCKAACKRKQGVIIFRMRCVACNGSDWCWNCLKPWKGSGLIVCSNNGCTLITYTNKVLAEAPKKTPEYLKNVSIPSIRACPMCMTFMEHKDACKHMKCIGCTGDFCFVCLGKKENGKWPCNDHRYECPVAPVQVFK